MSMKIKFLKPYPDPYNPAKTYLPGWVAEFSDPDAQAVIKGGFAHEVSSDVRARRYEAQQVSTECAPTGTTITLTELTGKKPKETKKEPESDLTAFFVKGALSDALSED